MNTSTYMELDLLHIVTTENTANPRWSIRKLNVDNCIEKIIEIRSRKLLFCNLDTGTSAEQLVDILTEVYNAGISRAATLGGHQKRVP